MLSFLAPEDDRLWLSLYSDGYSRDVRLLGLIKFFSLVWL